MWKVGRIMNGWGTNYLSESVKEHPRMWLPSMGIAKKKTLMVHIHNQITSWTHYLVYTLFSKHKKGANKYSLHWEKHTFFSTMACRKGVRDEDCYMHDGNEFDWMLYLSLQFWSRVHVSHVPHVFFYLYSEMVHIPKSHRKPWLHMFAPCGASMNEEPLCPLDASSYQTMIFPLNHYPWN